MPRQARIGAPGALQHIMIGNRAKKDLPGRRVDRKSQLRSQGVILSWVSERGSEVPGVDPDCIYRPGKYPRKRQGPESVLLLGRTGAWDACDLSCKDAWSDPARSEHLRETGANDCRWKRLSPSGSI